jgi:hypothetical protein
MASGRIVAALIGAPLQLPPAITDEFPELAAAGWRRGGLPPRVASWFLGGRVAAIALWRTVFVAPGVRLDPELLLHEFRHVHQFQVVPFFPLRYLWETGLRGYHANRFEADARRFATERLGGR